ncbi:MAG: exodeoxyribonuclease V subunit gamma [Phycisphaerae bacterium]|nr:exodeoxyribonuclease V subunit gamma [Phycisphaerae bacterium]MDD5381949.1 exodeoxyribonuclease V subunit gamma [Phycisphaerae bacterium]
MAVQFILGRSGTGKTSYCIKAIADELAAGADSQPLILLVPEQATYQAERAILNDKRVGGYHRLCVLSFARLQFLLSGKNTAKPAVTRIGQQMIIQRILRDNKSKLKLFGSSAEFPGLGRQMAETITELHEYAKTPEDIDHLLNQLKKDERNSLAALKFADIGLVLREYLKFIEGKFINPDVQLTRSCRAVATSALTKGAKLWVDGFAGFTTSELAILTELLKAAADAQIALCIDPLEIDLVNPNIANLEATSMFSPTERTYAELVEMVKKSKLRLAKPIILKDGVRFSRSRELAHIERNVFKLNPSKMPAGDSVRIVSAPNVRAEVQFVAREILRLLKEKEYRYRDIAVIASDIDRYEHYIRACFDDYGLPFFIDKRKSLNQHSAIALICSAMQAVLNGFSNSDIFSFLKTDLAPIERGEVDLLENYCLAFGVTGSDWISAQEWHFAGQDDKHFDEGRVNGIRKKVCRFLLELRDKLCPLDNPKKTMSAEEFTKAIFDFVDELGVLETIGGWAEETDEHRQFYDKFLDIFDEFGEVFAGQEETAEDYFAILDSAFSQMTLAFIPPTLDQVLVGSIERSRHPDLKAVFLIGTTQREFPVPVSFERILTDEDRIAAESVDFALAATAGQKLAERQYLAYIAFTRPREMLYITYPATDEGGGAETRSQFIDNLAGLFENLKEESAAGYKNDVERVHSKSELADLLCSQFGKDAFSTEAKEKEQLGGLLGDIAADKELAELGSEVMSAISYDNRAQLDTGIVKEIFAGELKNSATRLSTFSACPYQYFARYILELEEREEFKLEPLDLGNFYHRVLDALLKRLNSAKKDFAVVADDELLRLLREQIAKFASENAFISNFLHRSAHNGFIIHCAAEVLEDCVLAIAEMVRAGSFRPRWSEVSFGEAKDSVINIGKYKIKLPGGRVTALNGKIDRLDVSDDRTAIVFDYKRSGKSFNWSEFYHGLDMQLPIYMLAVKNADNPKFSIHNALGAFYMPVEVSPVKCAIEDLSEETEGFNYKAKGIFNGEVFRQLDKEASKNSRFYNFYVTKDGQPYGNYERQGALRPDDFEKALKFTEKKIIQLSEEILSGRIEVKPYRLNQKSPCSFCKYKAVCRFDWQVNEYNFLESLDKAGALEKMKGKNG